MFGVSALKFDAALGLELRLEDEPVELPRLLAEIHSELLTAGVKRRKTAATFYDQAVVECKYEIGDRVLLSHPPALVETGRTLRVSSLGPYMISEQQSPVSYTHTSEAGKKSAGPHVNRLRKLPVEADLIETEETQDGMWPDTRKVLRSSMERQQKKRHIEYKVRRRERNGFVRLSGTTFPEVFKKTLDLAEAGRRFGKIPKELVPTAGDMSGRKVCRERKLEEATYSS